MLNKIEAKKDTDFYKYISYLIQKVDVKNPDIIKAKVGKPIRVYFSRVLSPTRTRKGHIIIPWFLGLEDGEKPGEIQEYYPRSVVEGVLFPFMIKFLPTIEGRKCKTMSNGKGFLGGRQTLFEEIFQDLQKNGLPSVEEGKGIRIEKVEGYSKELEEESNNLKSRYGQSV